MSNNLRTLFTTAASISLFVTQMEAAEVFTAEQTKAIEVIIEKYLDHHPEAIQAAFQKALEKAQEEEKKQAKKNVIKYKEQIYGDSNSPVGGNPKGSISLVVFLDPYCGYCRRFETVLKNVAAKDKDLKIVYKVLPILGPESIKASREQIAAHMQGKFEAYQEGLFESAAGDREARLVIAKDNGLDVERLKTDVKSKHVKQQLQDNTSLAKVLGINGTPAFILGDNLISGMVDEENLIKMLAHMKEKKTS
ncbi:MAG: DsbA family protein [Alphaproteobacteria bacterium]|nr:DsbA family protein [Alphaproteobacteria bacterium]